jgi:hypothetical protein
MIRRSLSDRLIRRSWRRSRSSDKEEMEGIMIA